MPKSPKLGGDENTAPAGNNLREHSAEAARNNAIALMKQGKPTGYLISPAMYERLVATMPTTPSARRSLERDFEKMVARMHGPMSAPDKKPRKRKRRQVRAGSTHALVAPRKAFW